MHMYKKTGFASNSDLKKDHGQKKKEVLPKLIFEVNNSSNQFSAWPRSSPHELDQVLKKIFWKIRTSFCSYCCGTTFYDTRAGESLRSREQKWTEHRYLCSQQSISLILNPSRSPRTPYLSNQRPLLFLRACRRFAQLINKSPRRPAIVGTDPSSFFLIWPIKTSRVFRLYPFSA